MVLDLAATSGGLYPIALLVEELKSEDPEVRIAAMRRLQYIGKALGPERCRGELIPFLNGRPTPPPLLRAPSRPLSTYVHTADTL